MKRVIFGLLLMLGIGSLLGSCSKEETYIFTVPSKSILVSKPGDVGTTSFDSYNIASISATSIPEGWELVDINLYDGTITVKAPSSFDEEEVRNGDLSLKGYTPQGTSRTITIYLAILENADVDYTASPANCYIANKPDTRFVFNPYIGGNDIALATEKVDIVWQSRRSLIKYLDLRDGKASFYLEMAVDEDDEPLNEVYEGNAILGAYDKSGELIWSWHIWVTNGDPATDTITLNGQTLMNRNLGAFINSNASTDGKEIFRSYGLYYQWGSRNPYVGPQDYDFPGNHDAYMYSNKDYLIYLDYVESDAKVGTEAWSQLNPMAIIKGRKENGYDWLYEGHEALWSESTKTNNDPCPAGWRVPSKSIFEGLTIATSYDDMSWEEAQPLYGWMLEHSTTGEQYFFTAQGRRNYLDCRLDIINDDMELPIPWSGYYWTASLDGDNASAMYFDLNTATRLWNGFDAARAMHRANAMPLRCVKE